MPPLLFLLNLLIYLSPGVLSTDLQDFSDDRSFTVPSNGTERLQCERLQILDVAIKAGCIVSSFCLALAFLIFIFYRSGLVIRSTIHANIAFCLCLGELIFVVGIDRTSEKVFCSITAFLLHYLFLAAYCWLLLEGFQLWMTISHPFEPSDLRLAFFYILGYGIPAVIVTILAAVAWDDFGTEDFCWINTFSPLIWAFAGPIALMATVNVFFLLAALRALLCIRSRESRRARKMMGWFMGSATMFCLLGITWLFGYLTIIDVECDHHFYTWIFTILNCVQGNYIFVMHVLLNEKARAAVLRWLRSGADNRVCFGIRQRLLNLLMAGDCQSCHCGEMRAISVMTTSSERYCNSCTSAKERTHEKRDTPRQAPAISRINTI